MALSNGEEIPKVGEWPVPPQEDQPISKDRIWIDGCFDFSHHGQHQDTERLS
jgi:ethanolamine-phosphate cytidylyltransferase